MVAERSTPEVVADLHRSEASQGRISQDLVASWAMVALFLFFYTISYIDRTVISMLVGPIQSDLGLSDFQISLLLGPAFGLFYVLCGVPMGLLVDRHSRRWITFLGVSVWGATTAACGLAGSFPQLFLARMGVGVGESALTPTAHAMIAERFPRRLLATAMSIYTLGAVIGGGIAMAAGGLIVQMASEHGAIRVPGLGVLSVWQSVFGVLGGLTLLTAPLAFLIRESSARHAVRNAADGFVDTDLWKLLRSHGMLYIGLPIGFGFINAISQAYAAWVPTFMVREFGWSMAQVGAAWGVQHVVAGGVGFVGSAVIVDALYRRGFRDAHIAYPVIGLVVSAPLAVWGFYCGDPWLFLVLNAAFYFLSYGWIGYAAAALQMFSPPGARGRISAILLAIATILGMGLGAPLTGYMTAVVFDDPQRLGDALSVVTSLFAALSIACLAIARKTIRSMRQFDESPS